MLEEIFYRLRRPVIRTTRTIAVLAVIAALLILVNLVFDPKPDFWEIVLKSPMRVTAYIQDSSPSSTIQGDIILLQPGDKLTVSRTPSKTFFYTGERTHMLGYLEDGTPVDVPWPELQEEMGE